MLNKEMAEKQPEKKSNKRTLIIAFLAIILIVNGVKWYLDREEKIEMQAFYDTELEDARVRFAAISEELDEKIKKIDSLGGDIEELMMAKETIEAERDQLQRTRRANRRLIIELRDKVDGYEQLLKIKDKEIEQLTKLNQELFTQNTGLKEQTNRLNQSITQLNQNKEQLEEKVAVASQLKAENFDISAISKSGKEKKDSFRNRQIKSLRIEFDIPQNKVAPIEGKTILMRIIDENGQVLFDVARGSGTFMYGDKEQFYTESKDILFDNTNQRISYLYDKGSEYKSGKYFVEIYTDGYLMGKESFIIK